MQITFLMTSYTQMHACQERNLQCDVLKRYTHYRRLGLYLLQWRFRDKGMIVDEHVSNSNSADLQMRHQILCMLARHLSVGHFA